MTRKWYHSGRGQFKSCYQTPRVLSSENMYKILIMAVKGGTGKSTTTAGLAKALKAKGLRVGLMDLDIAGANLPTALGMKEPFPLVDVDVAKGTKFPVKWDGYEVYSLAFLFARFAVLTGGTEREVTAFGRTFRFRGTSRGQQVRQMLEHVDFSADLDYILYDLPPSTGDEALTLFGWLQDSHACILVSQPTTLSTEDMDRALDMIREKRLPLLGMVGNMIGTVCPGCGLSFNPFVDAGIDLEAFCRQRGVPYLVSIPLTADRGILDKHYGLLAEKVVAQKLVRIWQRSFRARFEGGITQGLIKGIMKGLKESDVADHT